MFTSARISAIALLVCALSSCAVGPTFHRPKPPPVDHYSNGTDPGRNTDRAWHRAAIRPRRRGRRRLVATVSLAPARRRDRRGDRPQSGAGCGARQLAGEPERFARRIRHFLSGYRCRGRRHPRTIQSHRVRRRRLRPASSTCSRFPHPSATRSMSSAVSGVSSKDCVPKSMWLGRMSGPRILHWRPTSPIPWSPEPLIAPKSRRRSN